MNRAEHAPFSQPWWHERIPTLQAAALTQEDFEAQLESFVDEALSEASHQGLQNETQFGPFTVAAKHYRLSLPAISSRRTAQLYIAAVAQGLQLNWITMRDAKVYLYGAQLALAAFSTQAPEPKQMAKRGEID